MTSRHAEEPPRPVRVLLVDDQALLRSACRVLVDSEPDMRVVGEASNGAEAFTLLQERDVDVVLLDLRMPDIDGLTVTRAIAADPALSGVRVIVLTTFETDEYVLRALRAGASGFLGKGTEPDELLSAIRIAARGEVLLSPTATKGLITRFLAQSAGQEDGEGTGQRGCACLNTLTGREREVLSLVAGGLSNDEIAGHLGVSPLTVKTHVNHTLAKLGARDRAQLVVIAYESGLVRPQRRTVSPSGPGRPPRTDGRTAERAARPRGGRRERRP